MENKEFKENIFYDLYTILNKCANGENGTMLDVDDVIEVIAKTINECAIEDIEKIESLVKFDNFSREDLNETDILKRRCNNYEAQLKGIGRNIVNQFPELNG